MNRFGFEQPSCWASDENGDAPFPHTSAACILRELIHRYFLLQVGCPREAVVSESSPVNPLSAPVVVVKKRTASPPKPYIPAIGPRLRVLLYIVFAGFAFLAASGIYLLVISV